MTDDPVARLPIDAAARRLPEFIKTLRINRAKRRESSYASDNVYALLDALDTAEARVRELEAENYNLIANLSEVKARALRAECALAEAYERAADEAFRVAQHAHAKAEDIAAAIRNLTQEERHAKAD